MRQVEHNIKAYGLTNGEGKNVPGVMPGVNITVLGGSETGAAFTVLYQTFPADFEARPHIHYSEDEAFYVLEGRMRFKCDGEEWEMGPGGFVHLPRGLMHAPAAIGGPARALVITNGFDFQEALTEIAAAELGGQPELSVIQRILKSHDLENFPPGSL